MRDRTNYMSGSVPWDLENKFGESKLQDREIISVILATADAYLNAAQMESKNSTDVNGNIAVNKFFTEVVSKDTVYSKPSSRSCSCTSRSFKSTRSGQL